MLLLADPSLQLLLPPGFTFSLSVYLYIASVLATFMVSCHLGRGTTNGVYKTKL